MSWTVNGPSYALEAHAPDIDRSGNIMFKHAGNHNVTRVLSRLSVVMQKGRRCQIAPSHIDTGAKCEQTESSAKQHLRQFMDLRATDLTFDGTITRSGCSIGITAEKRFSKHDILRTDEIETGLTRKMPTLHSFIGSNH